MLELQQPARDAAYDAGLAVIGGQAVDDNHVPVVVLVRALSLSKRSGSYVCTRHLADLSTLG